MAGERCIARVKVSTESAAALLEAVEPDNARAPEWLQVSCRQAEGALECLVELSCEDPQRLLSLRNTLDDLLLSLRAALDALEEGAI
ncbi:MAG: KEOPS complex subunit Pcc1 [Acidilobaceae archaeon]